ncbi:response regulator [Colwellia psychrerythraea]|uniref:histidine kinase n=1 Tax=Colwellia psychrerythraea TaxID=28229 RepID=A0A099KHT3_COLPS|nr:response regulator [Colwellia psychrerythraea]KGJ89133.1 integral membrane sensor hybrid histidine kinase [Colwellia psychrerythraea]
MDSDKTHGKPVTLRYKISEFIIRYSLKIAVLLMVTGIISAYFFLASTAQTLTKQTSQLNAQRYLEALSAFRTLYTEEVVNTAKKQNITISHDYKNIKNAIPLPATLSMALGKEIGKFQSGAKTFLYSPYPFPWRAKENKAIFSQDFSQQAWDSLTDNPKKAFFRFEEVNGQMSIRYAIADVMREGCIDCHNNHAQTPKNDWQLGDVRGVMEVILPINKAQFAAQSSLQATFIVLFTMMGLITIVLFIFFSRIKKDAKKLADSNLEMMDKQQQVNFANEEMSLAIEQLELKAIELVSSNQVKADFMATMSHEIRTPLNGVIGMLSLLKQSEMSHEQNHHTHLATVSASSLLNIINDILDFSKIEADKLFIESVEIHLADLVTNLSSTMAHIAHEKGLELIVDVAQLKHVVARGDPHRIKQILSNLISNAIKFTAKGEVVISTNISVIDDTKLQFSCSVKDTGIGIEQSKLDSMFERFTQEDSSTTRQYGGTGLGLAIVRKLCQLMHGDITVTSQQGRGSTFSFTLLLESCRSVKAELPQLDLSEYRILIVDDNKTNREVLHGQLTLWGACVRQADSAKSALAYLTESLKKAKDKQFDMAILDMHMPEMNGAQLGQQIKANNKLAHLKLIMLTSLARPGDAQYFASLGFDFSLPKPVITADLANAIIQVVNGNEPTKTQPALPVKNDTKKITVKPLPKSTRILLVEDNSINQIVAKSLLTNLGAQVEIASNGKEALSCLENEHFDAVLMDCQMPIMDGYTATKAIRKSHRDYTDIYIIAMTANAMSGDRDKCIAAGMNDYLTKPVDIIALENSLLKALNLPLDQIEAITPQINEPKVTEPKVTEPKVTNNDTEVKPDEPSVSSNAWGKEEFYKRVGQNQQLAERIVTMYCQDMPAEIDKLSQAITAKDDKEIEAIAHKVKGSSANLEATILAQCALEIELAVKENNSDEIELLSIKLKDDFAELIAELEGFLAYNMQ